MMFGGFDSEYAVAVEKTAMQTGKNKIARMDRVFAAGIRGFCLFGITTFTSVDLYVRGTVQYARGTVQSTRTQAERILTIIST